MLTAIADSGSFTVGPSPGLIIITIVMLVSAWAGVVTAMKGLWLWLLVGLFTSGLVWWYSAFLPPKPDSLWARRIARRRTSDTA